MKVPEVRAGRVAEKRKAKKAEGADSAAFARHLNQPSAEKIDATETAAGSSAIAGVGAILAAQEVDDGGQEARRNLSRHGEDILERLDEIRAGLLSGSLSRTRLENLAQLLKVRKATVDDPRLLAIIGEIELRAQVELAKYTRKI